MLATASFGVAESKKLTDFLGKNIMARFQKTDLFCIAAT